MSLCVCFFLIYFCPTNYFSLIIRFRELHKQSIKSVIFYWIFMYWIKLGKDTRKIVLNAI